MYRLITSVALFLTVSFSGFGASPAQLKEISHGFNSVYTKAKPCVVRINTTKTVVSRSSESMDPFEFFFRGGRGFGGGNGRTQKQRQQGLGTGVIINKDGTILTNNHVVGNMDEISVELFDGRTVKAKILGTDPRTDIAVIKINSPNLTPIELGDSDKVEVGDWALTLGFPFGLSYTFTLGIISAKGRSNLGLADFEDFLQTDAAVNPGNSGGPLMDVEGKLVGINTAILAPTGTYSGVSLAVPVNMALAVADSLKKNGSVIRGYLGIYPQDLSDDLVKAFKLKTNKGVLISDVAEDGPAGKAGLKAGDIVTEVDGKPVSEATQFRQLIASQAPGKTVTLKINREGSEKILKVTLGELKTENEKGGRGRGQKEEEETEENSFGFTVQDMNREQAAQYNITLSRERAAVITDVQPGSPAHQSGLQPGDVILEINRKPVLNGRDAGKTLQKLKGKSEILLSVSPMGRGKRYLVLKQGD